MADTRIKRAGLAAASVGALGAAFQLVRLNPHLVWTMAGPALVYTLHPRHGEPTRVLRAGGVYQSATYLGPRRMEPVFAYYRAFGRVFELVPNARRVLAIGGGGFAFPKLVASEHPEVLLDAVEIDPAVIRAARRWFFLDEAQALFRAGGGELRVVCEDGRAFLEAGAGLYDAVVLDVFLGEQPVRSLATVEAFTLVRRALAPGGVCLMNVVSRANGTDVDFLRSVTATALMVFSQVAVVPVSDATYAAEDNYLLVASNTPLALPDAIPYDVDFLGEVLLDGYQTTSVSQ